MFTNNVDYWTFLQFPSYYHILTICSSKDVKPVSKAGTLMAHLYTKTLIWKSNRTTQLRSGTAKRSEWFNYTFHVVVAHMYSLTFINIPCTQLLNHLTIWLFLSGVFFLYSLLRKRNLYLHWWVAVLLLIIIVEQCFNSAPELHLLVALNFYSLWQAA